MEKKLVWFVVLCPVIFSCRIGAGDKNVPYHPTYTDDVLNQQEFHGEVPFTPNLQLPSEVEVWRNLPRPQASHGQRSAQSFDDKKLEELAQEFERATLARKNGVTISNDTNVLPGRVSRSKTA